MYDCEYLHMYYIELIIHLGNNFFNSFKHPRNEAHDSPRLPLVDFGAGNCFLFRLNMNHLACNMQIKKN